MRTVANTLKDIHDEFRYHLADIKHVAASFCTVDLSPLKVRVWTLLDVRDEMAARQLATAERKLRESFQAVTFDFNTTHLSGRDPRQFIPEGALPIMARDPVIAGHFSRAASAA